MKRTITFDLPTGQRELIESFNSSGEALICVFGIDIDDCFFQVRVENPSLRPMLSREGNSLFIWCDGNPPEARNAKFQLIATAIKVDV